jgi:hypothetical protein
MSGKPSLVMKPTRPDLAFDQCVGGDRGAVHDGLDLAEEGLERHAVMGRRNLEDIDQSLPASRAP